MQDIRQNPKWRTFCETKGLKTVIVPTRRQGVNLQGILMPFGIFGINFLKIQRGVYDPDWLELKKIKKKYRVISSVIEPIRIQSIADYKRNGYKQSNFPYLATKTIVIDLKKSVDKLWGGLSENAKRLVNKNKIEVKEVTPKEFLDEWKKSSKIWTTPLSELEGMKQSLGKNVFFLIGYIEGKCQSGILLVDTIDMTNYFHTFTSTEGRKTGAHYGLVWKTILDSKKRKKKFYDFEGIFDPRWPQKKWLGFTEFKNKFGGDVVTHPGCFYKWF